MSLMARPLEQAPRPTDRAPVPRDDRRRFGPDGGLYIADWSNPIIQHGEVDFRDPRRDHEHGRIWRVIPAGGTTRSVALEPTSDASLLAGLGADDQTIRLHAQRLLTERSATSPAVGETLAPKLQELLDAAGTASPHALERPSGRVAVKVS